MKESGSLRSSKLEYLQFHMKSVIIKNVHGEYEIVSTKNCKSGDIVWLPEVGDTFTKTRIY